MPVFERILGVPVAARDRLESRGIVSARFRVGETWIVLVQPVAEGTVPARHLEAHGEGFFLMSLEAEDLASEVDRIGADAFDGPARQGIENWHVRDLDVARTFGAQLQLMEEK